MNSAVRRLVAIDLRSLAAFRIAIGIVLLIDLGIRATDLSAMYTDQGMFSRATISRHYSIWNWSFHFASGSWPWQAGLFAFAALMAAALLVGFETRLATVASWLMLVSLHNRVPQVLTGADNLLRLFLFWGMFLPLNGVWSVDARSAKRRGLRRAGLDPPLSVATAGILLQVAFSYLFSAIFKSNADWLHGKAMAAILTDGFYGKPVGVKLVDFPRALAILTVTILAIEWLGPFLLFSPVRTAGFRGWIVGLLASMHVGIALMLNVGLFPPVSLSGLLLFLPSRFWDRLPGSLGGPIGGSGPLKTPTGLLPGTRPLTASLAANGACAVVLAYVVFINLNELPGRLMPWTPVQRTEFLTVSCGLGQKWDMFAEAPSRDGWYVARATLVDGTQVDLFRRGAPVVWDRPRDPAAAYPNHRWRKFFLGMAYADATGFEVFRRPAAEYLCRDWNRNRTDDKKVSNFALVFCMEKRKGSDPGILPTPIRATFVHVDFEAPEEKR